jgi:hypothetical protein
MTMTLASILSGVIFAALGACIVTMRGEKARERYLKVLRCRVLDGVLLFLASAWFLWIVANLGQADFGDYKAVLFAVFLAIAIGAWFFVRDFLGVRAAAVLFMLCSWYFLGAAFGHYEVPARLWMVSGLYAGLVATLYLGAAPYRARDVMEFFTRHPLVSAVTGGALAVYGLWLCLVPVLFY